jgi:phosphate starvation-inducible PhoH-like protein
LLLHGIAGTGKTFISLYLALQDVTNNANDYNKVVIVRSVVPTRDMGFLPGNHKDKAKVYEAPYYIVANELFGRGDAYEILKQKNLVEFISTSFIRGTTLNDCVVVVDEIGNMTMHELDSVITRCGKNCKVIFSGDFRQSDLTREQERNGLKDFMRILDRMKSFEYVEFDENDIVRSGLVKEYIIAKDRLKITA